MGKEFYNWLINPNDRVKLIDFEDINNNDFAVVDEGIVKVYNYMLDLVGEITPIEPTSNIVGMSLSFEGAAKYKKLVLTLAYLNGDVLYSTVDEIKLS